MIGYKYVNENVDMHEEFTGLYECPNMLANTVVACLQDVMLRLNLQLSCCRGQCYDGGSNMAGCKSRVKVQMLQLEPRALFTHCYGHSHSQILLEL